MLVVRAWRRYRQRDRLGAARPRDPVRALHEEAESDLSVGHVDVDGIGAGGGRIR